MKTERRLGILGGMGPLASAQFMCRLTQLTPARRDQEHIPTVLWSDPRVPDRTTARLGGGADPLPWLARGLTALEQAGCGAVAIPCNTAHGWHDEMVASTRLPILHIVDGVAAALGRRGISGGAVGIMGTAGTLAMGLYQQRLERLGYACLVPPSDVMRDLVMPAIGAVKAGRVGAARAPLLAAARALAQAGADAVVLACTEIPLAVHEADALHVGAPLVDTIDALATFARDWARARPGDGRGALGSARRADGSPARP